MPQDHQHHNYLFQKNIPPVNQSHINTDVYAKLRIVKYINI